MRVAVLGGTIEARELASCLHAIDAITVETSLAGRTAHPLPIAGSVRSGGFGGVEAMTEYLRDFDKVVNATHPFAASVSRQVRLAAAAARLPLLVLRRPGATAGPGDKWQRVPSVEAAAAYVRTDPADCVFLAIGRTQLAAFASGGDRKHFVIRAIETPAVLPARHTLRLGRGPFSVEGEVQLMRTHQVQLMVCKDSGGAQAKLDAARELGLTVVLVDRPPTGDDGPVVETVADALSWVVSSSR